MGHKSFIVKVNHQSENSFPALYSKIQIPAIFYGKLWENKNERFINFALYDIYMQVLYFIYCAETQTMSFEMGPYLIDMSSGKYELASHAHE
jgi:hypothetical protein